jgi:hypothetical protein
MLFDELDGMLEVGHACSFGTVVSGGYEVVDGEFILVEEGVNMLLI